MQSASPLEIVGVAGKNKLAITLMPVNKCILYHHYLKVAITKRSPVPLLYHGSHKALFCIVIVPRLTYCIVPSLTKDLNLQNARLYLQLFVMSYLRCLCLFAYRGVPHILCCVFCFVCLRRVSCVSQYCQFL